MPTPSVNQTLNSRLGPDITVIHGGGLISEEERSGGSFDITTMNAEIESFSKKDKIVFLQSEPSKEDIPFQKFLESQKQNTAQ